MGRIGKVMVWIYEKTPWGKRAAKEAAEKAATQAARRKAIQEGGEGAVDIARQTVGRSRKGSAPVGASVVIALIGIGVGLLFPPSIPGMIGGAVAGAIVEKGAEAAIGTLSTPATPTPEPKPTEEPRQPVTVVEEQPYTPPQPEHDPEAEATPSVIVIQSTPHPDDNVDVETPEPHEEPEPEPHDEPDPHGGGHEDPHTEP